MSFALVAGLPGAEAHHRADVQAALAGGPGSESMTAEQPWPWPETMDALLAAPAAHRVLLDNDRYGCWTW